MKKTILTGLKPTGDLTIGNYIGAIKPMVKMQYDYDNNYLFVADLHALTVPQNPDDLKSRIKRFIAMYVACGIDPSKTTIYIQSENEYIPAISWLLECTTQFGEASRMIQFKEKSKENANFSVGLLTYPILMAADILFCDTTIVPVGIDQKQHVEIARDIAIRFNNRYGNTFVVPEVLITKDGTKIKDLKDPSKKMSKSDDSPTGVITMFDTSDEIIKKINRATTDSDAVVKFDEEHKLGISNLINLVVSLTDLSIKDVENMFDGKNYGEFKKFVGETVVNFLAPVQTRYEQLLTSGELDQILDEGIAKARAMAKAKYLDMCQKMGVTRN